MRCLARPPSAVPRPSPQTSCAATGPHPTHRAGSGPGAVVVVSASSSLRPPWWPTNFPYAGRSGAGGGSLVGEAHTWRQSRRRLFPMVDCVEDVQRVRKRCRCDTRLAVEGSVEREDDEKK
jgi:hypothetical protein